MANLNSGIIKVSINPKTVSGQVNVPVRVQGLMGEKGESGVWTGSGTPPEGYNVWIDPSGDTVEFVQSVNGKTGEVQLNADDVGALSGDQLPDSLLLTNSDLLDIWNSY